MQGLSIRVARAVNGELGRRGSVFADRYHARALRSPRAVHVALRYVLVNARKHERGAGAVPVGFVDECSSAPWFSGLARPPELAFGVSAARRAFAHRVPGMAAPVAAARTWLLRFGHQRAGPIDIDAMPAQGRAAHPMRPAPTRYPPMTCSNTRCSRRDPISLQ